MTAINEGRRFVQVLDGLEAANLVSRCEAALPRRAGLNCWMIATADDGRPVVMASEACDLQRAGDQGPFIQVNATATPFGPLGTIKIDGLAFPVDGHVVGGWNQLQAVMAGKFYVATRVRGQRPMACLVVKPAMPLRRYCGERYWIDDPVAAYWWVRDRDPGDPYEAMEAEARRSCGWVKAYESMTRSLRDRLARLERFTIALRGLSSTEDALLECANNVSDGPNELLKRLCAIVDGGIALPDLFRVSVDLALRVDAETAHGRDYVESVGQALPVLACGSRHSESGGKVLTQFGSDGRLEFSGVPCASLPEALLPENVWGRFVMVPHLIPEHPLKVPSVPAVIEEPSADQWFLAQDPDEADRAAARAGIEAIVRRKYLIPSGAVIELPQARIRYCRLWQRSEESVAFCFHPHESEYAAGMLNLATGDLLFPPALRLPSEVRRRVASGVRLLISLLARDLSVLERRESVFAPTVAADRAFSPRAPRSGLLIIYVARIQRTGLAYGREADRRGTHASPGEHRVRLHFRRAKRASPAVQDYAASIGVAIPSGFTMVKEHDRGGGAHAVWAPRNEAAGTRERVYRSRSAAQALLGEVLAPQSVSVQFEWLQFERIARQYVERIRKWRIVRYAQQGVGDHGIDIEAVDDKTGEVWVIQVKLRRVGEPLVLSHVGSIENRRVGTDDIVRGLFVALEFKATAKSAAIRNGMELVDGAVLERAGILPKDVWLTTCGSRK